MVGMPYQLNPEDNILKGLRANRLQAPVFLQFQFHKLLLLKARTVPYSIVQRLAVQPSASHKGISPSSKG